MNQILEHQALADEFTAILNEAPYPSLDALRARLKAARFRYSHAFNSGYEQEKLNTACLSLDRAIAFGLSVG